MTIKQVAARLGMDNAAARAVVNSGALTAEHVRGDKRQIDWFQQEQVDALREIMRDRINVTALNAQYMLTFTAVEQLVELGYLRWHPSNGVRAAYLGTYLMASECEAFWKRLDGAISIRGELTKDRMKLSECFALMGPVSKPWGPILGLAMEGKLPGGLGQISPKYGFRPTNLTVSRALALQVMLGEVLWHPILEPSRSDCSQFEAEERMSCNPLDISILIKLGIIKRFTPRDTKLSRNSVREAAEKWIMSRELAARIGIGAQKAAVWARKWGVKRPNGVPAWRRCEVEPLLPPLRNGAKTWPQPSVVSASTEPEADIELPDKLRASA